MSNEHRDEMTKDERLDAVASLFAKAVVRHRKQRRTSLDVRTETSVTVTTVTRSVDHDRRRR